MKFLFKAKYLQRNYNTIKLLLFVSVMVLSFPRIRSAQPQVHGQSGIKSVSQQQSLSNAKEDSDPIPQIRQSSIPMKYSSKSSPTAATSSYYAFPPQPYNGYYYASTGAEPYYDDYYERPGRQFSARSANYPMLAGSSSQVGFSDTEYGGLTAATGHNSHGHSHSSGHSGSHGHGHNGWGWGSTGHHAGYSKVDNSSLGLLGLLGLLSLLSNVLMLITTTATTAMGRRKRDTNSIIESEGEYGKCDKVEETCQRVLPSLNVIGHIHNRQLPVACSPQEVCKANKILVHDFGIQGRTVGSLLSAAVLKMLKEIDQSPGLDKYLLQASLDGRNGMDCEILYPACPLLENNRYRLPQLISPQHVSAIVHGRNPHIFKSKLNN